MRFVSLFDGIGAFTLGFVRAGWTPAALVEIDEHCRRVTAQRFPGVPQFADVREVRGCDIGPVDLVLGGSPCQDFSVAGKRAGLAGSRGPLYAELARIARECSARWICWENVPGVLSNDNGNDFARVLETFTGFRPQAPKDGWDSAGCCFGADGAACWRVLDLQWFRIPQRRRRVFLVVRPGDAVGLATEKSRRHAGRLRQIPFKVLFDGESLCGNPPACRQEGASVASGVAPGARRASGNRGSENLVAASQRSRQSSPGVGMPGRGGEDDQNIMFQANGAGAERAGSPTLASSDDNGSNQVVVGSLQAHAARHGHAMGTQQAAESGHLVVGSLTGHHPRDTTDDNVVAHQCHGSNVGPMGALRAGNGNEAGGVPFVSHSLRAGGCDASEDGTGRGTPLVAYVTPRILRNSKSCNEVGIKDGSKADSLSSDGPGAVIAFQERTREQGRTLESQEGTAYSLNAPAGVRRRQENNIQSGMVVRRLTPTECARLQGLPDDWMDLDPPLSDSRKYHALGNAGGVPVLEYLARRIMAVEQGVDPNAD